MKPLRLLIAAVTLSAGTAALPQLLPRVPDLGTVVGRPLAGATDVAGQALGATARQLADARRLRLDTLVRAHPREVALDPLGNPARAGEVVVSDPDDALLAAATARGFRLIERETAIGIGYARLARPEGLSLRRAITVLTALGGKEVSADPLHLASGDAHGVAAVPVAAATGGSPIGMIDGGVASAAAQRGFATGAPRPSQHGTAIASLILGAGRVRGASPGARLLAADVYGDDPAGGSATAIVRALAWLVGERVPVVSISLVGPPHPLLARVVAAAQARGTILVAAVGNDGPAAPPSYPASYPGVIAVTAIDARRRVLIEAGRATHLDYAAPGADMLAGGLHGEAPVRGTSFAAPLVAATILAAYPAPVPAARAAALARVDAAAERPGARYGRGIVCAGCATSIRQGTSAKLTRSP